MLEHEFSTLLKMLEYKFLTAWKKLEFKRSTQKGLKDLASGR